MTKRTHEQKLIDEHNEKVMMAKTYIFKINRPRIDEEMGDYYNGEFSDSIEELIEQGIIEEEIET